MPKPTELIARARWIDSDRELSEFVDRAKRRPQYFIDTEFHRERTYFPQLALVQIGIEDEIVLIDPLAVDAAPLCDLFQNGGRAVLHAAQQDMDVLAQACGMIPHTIFDTQLAAGFMGYSTPSLVSLVSTLVRVTVPKGDRLTDWLRRPLTATQCEYAASDVAYLPDLTEIITTELKKSGRLGWAEEACEELRARPTGPQHPDMAWLRLKDVRTLKGSSRWIARSVASWRERRAMELDVPPRHVLADLAVLGIAQRSPRTPSDLSHSRGIDARQAQGSLGKALLAAVEQGLVDSQQGELQMPTPEGDDLERSLRPAVTLVSAWVTELARQQRIDPMLLGTRSDIVDLLRGLPGARLRHGWRADIVGHDVEALVAGKAGLTFTPGGHGLRLVTVEQPESP